MYREERLNIFTLVEYEEFKVSKPTYMIVGLPDTGLVGVIASSYLVKKLGVREIGGFISSYVAPIVSIVRGLVKPPIRIFRSEDIVIVYSEILPDPRIVHALGEAIILYAQKIGVDLVISITGLPIQNRLEASRLNAYFVSSDQELVNRLVDKGLKMFDYGYLVGPYASMMIEGQRRGIKAVTILVESFLEFPDPEASAKGLEELGKILGKDIDVRELLEEGEIIRARARELMRRTIHDLAGMKKSYEYMAPLYT